MSLKPFPNPNPNASSVQDGSAAKECYGDQNKSPAIKSETQQTAQLIHSQSKPRPEPKP